MTTASRRSVASDYRTAVDDSLVAQHREQGHYARPGGIPAEILARTALSRWQDGDRDPAMITLVTELLGNPQTQDLAKSFVHAAIALPETHLALLDAIQPNGFDFASHAIKTMAVAAPQIRAGNGCCPHSRARRPHRDAARAAKVKTLRLLRRRWSRLTHPS